MTENTVTIKDNHDKIQSMLLAGINNLLMDMNDQQELTQKSIDAQLKLSKLSDERLSKLLDLNVSLININIETQQTLNSLFGKGRQEKSNRLKLDKVNQLKLIDTDKTTKIPSLQQCVNPQCDFSVDVVDASKTLDDIFNQFAELIEVTKQNQTTLNSISNQTSIVSDGINKSVDLIGKNQISLDNILEVNNNMTNQIGKLLDEGGNRVIQDVAPSTDFYIINTTVGNNAAPGWPVKSMVFANSCDELIYVGINVAESTIGPDIMDTIADDSRFIQVLPNKHLPIDYNVRGIDNIWIRAKKNTAKFQCILTW